MPPPTVNNARRQALEALRPACLSEEQCRAEVDWMLEALLPDFRKRRWEAGNAEPVLSPADWERLQGWVHRRVTERVPIQYLLGEAWFYGLRFTVTPDVLIPRPETELLVEEAGRLAEALPAGCRILDFGTGSGCIAVALAKSLGRHAEVTAIDVSEAALAVARQNATDCGTDAIRFMRSDGFERLAGERFDLVVSNPPYVDPGLTPTLQPEVLAHEPHLALFPQSGDTLHFYRLLAQEGPRHLSPGGWLLVETGAGMTAAVSRLFADNGFRHIQTIQDYGKLDRMVRAVWLGEA